MATLGTVRYYPTGTTPPDNPHLTYNFSYYYLQFENHSVVLPIDSSTPVHKMPGIVTFHDANKTPKALDRSYYYLEFPDGNVHIPMALRIPDDFLRKLKRRNTPQASSLQTIEEV